MTSLGARFEAERERLSLSRAELAHASGYSAEQIRKVEKDLSEPGAGLLATMLKVGADLQQVLLGDPPAVRDQGAVPYTPTADEMAASMYRHNLRLEAKEHARLKNDRRKRVVTDDEADLLDAFRDLSAADRRAVLASVASGSLVPAPQPPSAVTVHGRGNRVAGRDYVEGKKS